MKEITLYTVKVKIVSLQFKIKALSDTLQLRMQAGKKSIIKVRRLLEKKRLTSAMDC